MATIAAPAFASDVVKDQARERFAAGVSFLQDPDEARHEHAYRDFNAACAASLSWKILGNLGIAAMKLGAVDIGPGTFLVAGGVGLATGVTLQMLSGGNDQQPAAARLQPYWGTTSLGIRGSF